MTANIADHLAAQHPAEGHPQRTGAHPQRVCGGGGRLSVRSGRGSGAARQPCRLPATWGFARTMVTTATTVTPRSARGWNCSASWATWTSSRPANWRTGRLRPFDPVEENGNLHGRGTQDDKGPLLAALFAVKALMDADMKFNKRVRFIFGTDEETLWRCINRYKEKEELPGMGFSPDARFPLIFAEKGCSNCTWKAPTGADCTLRADPPSTPCPTRCSMRVSGRTSWRKSSMSWLLLMHAKSTASKFGAKPPMR